MAQITAIIRAQDHFLHPGIIFQKPVEVGSLNRSLAVPTDSLYPPPTKRYNPLVTFCKM
ncbi:hypothetical protein QUB17_29390 [Microcoleus sp. B5-C4]